MFSSLNSDFKKAWNIFIPSKQVGKKSKLASICDYWLLMRLHIGTYYKVINLHFDAKSLSSDCDHWDISSKQSLLKKRGSNVTNTCIKYVNSSDILFLWNISK